MNAWVVYKGAQVVYSDLQRYTVVYRGVQVAKKIEVYRKDIVISKVCKGIQIEHIQRYAKIYRSDIFIVSKGVQRYTDRTSLKVHVQTM